MPESLKIFSHAFLGDGLGVTYTPLYAAHDNLYKKPYSVLNYITNHITIFFFQGFLAHHITHYRCTRYRHAYYTHKFLLIDFQFTVMICEVAIMQGVASLLGILYKLIYLLQQKKTIGRTGN